MMHRPPAQPVAALQAPERPHDVLLAAVVLRHLRRAPIPPVGH